MNLIALGKVSVRLRSLYSTGGVVGQKKTHQVFVQGTKETGTLVYTLLHLLTLGI